MANTMEEMASKGMAKVKAAKAAVKGFKGIFKQLAKEHGEAAALLERLASTDDPSVRSDLFPTLRAELLAHERAELTQLYPLLRHHPETRSIAGEHEREANALESLIEDLAQRAVDDPAWGAKFERLVEMVESHVSEEEDEYFPLAQGVLGEQAAEDLVDEYLAKKKAVMQSLSQ